MQVRGRDIPFLMLEVACWTWLLGCLFVEVIFVLIRLSLSYDGPQLVFPVVAAVPALVGVLMLSRYCLLYTSPSPRDS